jgi:thiazole synthase
LEIVRFVGGGLINAQAPVRGRQLDGRGTHLHFAADRRHGQIQEPSKQNAAAVEASGAEIVTVAVRRVNVSDPEGTPMLTDFIDPEEGHLPAEHGGLLHGR